VGTDLTGDGDVVVEIEREPSYIFEEIVKWREITATH
jgi:hypothetical protein